MNEGIDIGSKFFNGKPFLTKIEDVGTLVSTIVQNIFVIVGLVFLFLIIIGGITFISGAGNSNPEQAEKGKKAVVSAGIGFLVVFTAYWLVQLIGKITGIKIL